MPVNPAALPLQMAARPDLTGGRRIAVLLSHGFTGTPYAVRAWGEYLGRCGYGVDTPRLPGHGTTWQEMNRTGWSDWYGEVSRRFEHLAATHDAVVAGGLSMGGALVLSLAEHYPELAGLILVNPGISSTRKDILTLPVLKHLLPSLPGLANDINKPGGDEHGYTRLPLKAAHEMVGAWPGIRRRLDQVTAPILYFRSVVDHIVDDSTEPLITRGVSSRDIEVRMLANSYHVATLDYDSPEIFTESARFVARVTQPASAPTVVTRERRGRQLAGGVRYRRR